MIKWTHLYEWTLPTMTSVRLPSKIITVVASSPIRCAGSSIVSTSVEFL